MRLSTAEAAQSASCGERLGLGHESALLQQCCFLFTKSREKITRFLQQYDHKVSGVPGTQQQQQEQSGETVRKRPEGGNLKLETIAVRVQGGMGIHHRDQEQKRRKR